MAQNQTVTMIEDIRKRDAELTEWEEDFIASLEKALQWARRISKKQDDILTKIWERATEQG